MNMNKNILMSKLNHLEGNIAKLSDVISQSESIVEIMPESRSINEKTLNRYLQMKKNLTAELTKLNQEES